MIFFKNKFITTILVSLFSSTLVAACGSDAEEYPDLGQNDCFEEMQSVTEKKHPTVEDMGKVAIRNWTFNGQIFLSQHLKNYYIEMERHLDYDAVQSPSVWCSENANRLAAKMFEQVISDDDEEDEFEQNTYPTYHTESSSSGWFGNILRKGKGKQKEVAPAPPRYINDREQAKIISRRMRDNALKEDQLKNCLALLTEFGESSNDALLFAFYDRNLEFYNMNVGTRVTWTINFRYNYMEYLMNNVKFRPLLRNPHDYCYRDVYYHMNKNDKRKILYLERRTRNRQKS